MRSTRLLRRARRGAQHQGRASPFGRALTALTAFGRYLTAFARVARVPRFKHLPGAEYPGCKARQSFNSKLEQQSTRVAKPQHTRPKGEGEALVCFAPRLHGLVRSTSLNGHIVNPEKSLGCAKSRRSKQVSAEGSTAGPEGCSSS